jgi:hypothetical protein
MAISHSDKLFRSERAQDLITLAELLESVGIQSYKIREASKELKDFGRTKKIYLDDEIDYSFWGYSIDSFEIPFNRIPHHMKPEGLNPVSAYISIDVIGSTQSWGKIVDPFKKLEFNIELAGCTPKNTNHRMCYHIDRHIESNSTEPHPIYHLHFGGNRMNFNEVEIGDIIFLDYPRVMFHPIEIILGLDFVLSNFFPDYWNDLQRKSDYNSLINDYYKALVKPFAHTLASKWTGYDPSSIDWHPDLLFPQLATL